MRKSNNVWSGTSRNQAVSVSVIHKGSARQRRAGQNAPSGWISPREEKSWGMIRCEKCLSRRSVRSETSSRGWIDSPGKVRHQHATWTDGQNSQYISQGRDPYTYNMHVCNHHARRPGPSRRKAMRSGRNSLPATAATWSQHTLAIANLPSLTS